jgi:hypothetical protein
LDGRVILYLSSENFFVSTVVEIFREILRHGWTADEYNYGQERSIERNADVLVRIFSLPRDYLASNMVASN